MPDFSTVQRQELDAATLAWFTGVLETIETLDARAYADLMTDDVELRLPDGTVLHGRAEVAATLGAAWTSLIGLVHQEHNIYGDASQVVHEALAVSTLADGTESSGMSTSWISRAPDGRIATARVYG